MHSLMLTRARKISAIVRRAFFLNALVRHGVAAGVENSLVLGALQVKGLRTVVDIGANRGQFALVARSFFPLAKIISFEPLREPASLFRRVFANDPQTTLYEIAIGPLEYETNMHVSRADDASSLLPITALQNQLYPGTLEKETRVVQVKPLDAVLSKSDIEQPALLKLDVQGFEKEALGGCGSLLSKFTYAYVECSFMELYAGQTLAHEIIGLLSEFEFALSGVYNLSYDRQGTAIQGDFLFER